MSNEHSRLKDGAVRQLCRLSRLRTLHLNGGRSITSDPIMAFTELRQMRDLGLAHCNVLESVVVSLLPHFPLLESLSLQGCALVGDESVRAAVGLPHLRWLNLSHCERITDSGAAELHRATALTTLDISGCRQISDRALLPALRKMRHLRHLYMRDCAQLASDAGPRIARALPCLHTFALGA